MAKTERCNKKSVKLRKHDERGHVDHGWLDTFHTFSFAGYFDETYMGFRALCVINEDRVQPGKGFGIHPHADMEILTYVLKGELEHRDSMGNGSVIRPGDVQLMTAGTGITHSEFNPSPSAPVHFLQIWILPDRKGREPGYAQKTFSDEDKRNRLCLIVSRGGREGSLVIHQQADIYAGLLEEGRATTFTPKPGRHIWIQTLRGIMTVNGATLVTGDGLSASEAVPLEMTSVEKAEFLLFDLA